eukprot:m.259418 g.259418  ORF g.259418 m.259418 type:complete len:316 (-) comp35303_c0_seq1:250-1197(-)
MQCRDQRSTSSNACVRTRAYLHEVMRQAKYRSIVFHKHHAKRRIFKCTACAKCHTGQRLLRDGNRQARRPADHGIKVFQQSPATGKHHAKVYDISGQLWGCLLQRDLYTFHNLAHRLRKGLGHLKLVDFQLFRHAIHQVTSLDDHCVTNTVFRHQSRADLLLDTLSRGFTNEKVVIAANITDQRLVHLVSAHAHTGCEHNTRKRKHGYLGGTAAYINHHGALWLCHRQAGANCRGHRLINQIHLTGTSLFSRFLYGLALHRCGTTGYTHNNLRARKRAVVDLLDKMLDHLLGNMEIGNHTVPQRANGLNAAWRTP